jgi:hypothetical protein
MRILGGHWLGFILLYSSVAHAGDDFTKSFEHANDDPVKWSWSCVASGFYSMEVSPDGTFTPSSAPYDHGPIRVDVRQAGEFALGACGERNTPTQYFLEVTGSSLFRNNGLCDQRVYVHNKYYPIADRKAPDLEGIDAVGVRDTNSFSIHRADADWRFVLSSTDLTTDRESKRLRTTVPYIAPSRESIFDPKASVSLLTGECTMITGQ